MKKAFFFFMEGLSHFSDIEENGICTDESYFEEKDKELEEKQKELTISLLKSEEAQLFKERTGTTIKLTSDDDLRLLLFEYLDLEPLKFTGTDLASVDQSVLMAVDNQFAKDLISLRKIEKTKGTYLSQYLRESYKGAIHPFFDLHIPRTYRSSAHDPNLQNTPVRDKFSKEVCRSGLIPSKGNIIIEVDFSSMEVRIIACNTHDPVLIKYIKSGGDLHKDQAIDCFMLPEDEIHKDIRFYAKNQFVFPEFYGSYFVSCARDLYKMCWYLPTNSGTLIKDHMADRSINTLEEFTEYTKEVEERFWKKYAVTRKWQDNLSDFMVKNLYIELKTGFRCVGHMTRNKLYNFPVQGPAFHCLLWSLIQINKQMKAERMKSKIIGQIHDSLLFDAHPTEASHIISMCQQVMTVDIIKEWPWIIVPLEIEVEMTEVDQPWYTKEKYQLAA
jgi:DNA polymerase-1